MTLFEPSALGLAIQHAFIRGKPDARLRIVPVINDPIAGRLTRRLSDAVRPADDFAAF
jgi:hypothetical protein